MTASTKKITMAELARLADVDVSTVSRALNDSPLVKQQTKQQIIRIANEVGYAVNASARNLRRRSSEAIGMVIPVRPVSGQTLNDPFFLEMMGAVSHAVTRRGYDLILSSPQGDQQIAERRLLQSGKADGLIIIGQAGNVERLNAIDAHSAAVVVWGGRTDDVHYTLAGSDNVLGGRLAGAHLLGLGRRRILFIGDDRLPEVALRRRGFLEAHAEASAPVDPALVLKLDFGGEPAYRAVRQFLKDGPAFDAVFAASDVLAIAAMHALQAQGGRVPEDVSVVGYDNIGQAALATPALTTIDQHIAQGGEMMVELLFAKLAGENAASKFTETTLVVRASCGGRV